MVAVERGRLEDQLVQAQLRRPADRLPRRRGSAASRTTPPPRSAGRGSPARRGARSPTGSRARARPARPASTPWSRSSGLPRLKIGCPLANAASRWSTMKRDSSLAARNARTCWPPANTVSGRPSSACCTNVGTTNPPARDWRGPATLNGRTTRPRQAVVAAVDRHRLGERLGDRVLEARVVVRGHHDRVALAELPGAAVDLGGAEGAQLRAGLEAAVDHQLGDRDDLVPELALVLEDPGRPDVRGGVDHYIDPVEATAAPRSSPGWTRGGPCSWGERRTRGHP